MKNSTHKLSLSLIFLSFIFSISLSAKRNNPEKTKEINNTYQVGPETIIDIDNKFGEVKINHWDRNEVSIIVRITIKIASEKKAQALMEKINISIKESETRLSYETQLTNGQNKTKIETDKGFSIDYEVKMPINSPLKVKNSFGPLYIDDLNANVDIQLNFGGATIGKLNGAKSKLSFEFADPIIIDEIKQGTINIKHSKLELSKGSNIILESEMSSLKLGKIDESLISLELGSLEVKEVNKIELKAQMSSVKIESLEKQAEIETNYGSLTISNVSKNITSLSINSGFSPVKIVLSKTGNYNVDAYASMSTIKLPKGYSIKKYKEKQVIPSINEAVNKEFRGIIGNSSTANSTVRIRNSFGEIEIQLSE